MYRTKDDDVVSPLIGRSIGRAPFEEIKKHIHFSDKNHLPADNKLVKIRALQNAFKNSLLQFGAFSSDLFMHKQMVPYFGKLSLKMLIRKKPICFGYKNWVLALSDVYAFRFETYMGASKSKVSKKLLRPQSCCWSSDLQFCSEIFTIWKRTWNWWIKYGSL